MEMEVILKMERWKLLILFNKRQKLC